jgi:hypothetical protein
LGFFGLYIGLGLSGPVLYIGFVYHGLRLYIGSCFVYRFVYIGFDGLAWRGFVMGYGENDATILVRLPRGMRDRVVAASGDGGASGFVRAAIEARLGEVEGSGAVVSAVGPRAASGRFDAMDAVVRSALLKGGVMTVRELCGVTGLSEVAVGKSLVRIGGEVCWPSPGSVGLR